MLNKNKTDSVTITLTKPVNSKVGTHFGQNNTTHTHTQTFQVTQTHSDRDLLSLSYHLPKIKIKTKPNATKRTLCTNTICYTSAENTSPRRALLLIFPSFVLAPRFKCCVRVIFHFSPYSLIVPYWLTIKFRRRRRFCVTIFCSGSWSFRLLIFLCFAVFFSENNHSLNVTAVHYTYTYKIIHTNTLTF